MKLPHRHKISLLKAKEEMEVYVVPRYLRGGFNWINEKYQNVILENIHFIEFNHMYPRIMILLHEEELIHIPEDYNKLKSFFDNEHLLKMDNQSGHKEQKVLINSIYGKLLRNPDGYLINNLISKYQYQLYDEILENNPDNIVYIDTDLLVSVNAPNLLDCPIPYSTSNIDIALFAAKKIYARYDGELKIKGTTKYREKLNREILHKVREWKINKILS